MAGWGGELWKSSGCKFQTTSLGPGDCQTGAPFNFRLSPNWSRYVKSSSDTNLGAWRAQSVTPSLLHVSASTDVQDWASFCWHQKKKAEDQSGGGSACCSRVLLHQVSQTEHSSNQAHFGWSGPGERCKHILFLSPQVSCGSFCWLTLYFALGRWYVFGFATGDRRGSAWLCRWMRNWKASCMSRVLPPFPVRPTQGPVSLEALLPRSTCLNFPGLMSWNKPWILEWLGTQLDKAIVQPEPQIAFQKCAQLTSQALQMQQSNNLIVSELCEGEIKVVSGFSYGDCEMPYVTVFCDLELLWLHIAKGDVELRIYCMTMYWPMSPVFEFGLWLYGPDVEWGLVCKCSRAGVY